MSRQGGIGQRERNAGAPTSAISKAGLGFRASREGRRLLRNEGSAAGKEMALHLLLNPNESPLIESWSWLRVTLSSLGSARPKTAFDALILTNFFYFTIFFFLCFVSLYIFFPQGGKKIIIE